MTGNKVVGQDIRFLSTLCWLWCPDKDEDARFNAECLNGDTGFLYPYNDANAKAEDEENYSLASTYSLNKLFIDIISSSGTNDQQNMICPQTMTKLRELKWTVSAEYEASKEIFLQNHQVFVQWNRRQNRI